MYTILLVEDDEDSIELVKNALQMGHLEVNLISALDGIYALEYLTTQPAPDLILLDLNLPRKNGRQLLVDIAQTPALQKIPVVLLSTTEWHDDIRKLYPSLESQCFGKPMRFQDYIDLITSIYNRGVNRELRGIKT